MRHAIEYLNELPLVGLMLVITVGYTLGRLSLRRISLGPAAGTLFVALLSGHWGLTASPEPSDLSNVGQFGMALFIYSVGFEAGPRFFASFRDRTGWRFVLVGVLVNGLAVGTAVLCGWLLSLKGSTVAGMLAGAITSAPTFAAASEMTSLPSDRVDLSIAFAITFPLGLLGLVLMIQILPALLKDDLARDAESEEELLARHRRRWRVHHESESPEVTRTYEVVEAQAVGRSLREMNVSRQTGCVISRVLRRDEILIADGDTRLEAGDHVMSTGRIDELREFQKLIGPEVNRGLHKKLPRPRRIRVSRSSAVGRSLAELDIARKHHCVVTKIERGDYLVEPDADVKLARRDVIEVVGRRDDVRKVADLLGHLESGLVETDIAVYAGGILLGMLVGSIHLNIGGLDLRLGTAAGLLLVGLVLSRLGQIGHLRTQVPREARQLVRDLGILLFVADIGLHAGADVAEGIGWSSLKILAGSAAVIACSVLGPLLIGRYVLRLRPIDAWGSICGGLTSSAALYAVRRAADSNEAAISYAAAYAVASVLATLAGQLVIRLMA